MERIVLLVFVFWIEGIILWQYTINIFKPTHNVQFRKFFLIVLYLFLFLFSIMGNTGLNIALYFLVNTFFIYTQFQTKASIALFHSMILTVIMGTTELILLGIIQHFFPHFLTKQEGGLILYTIFSKFLFYSIVIFLSKVLGIKNVEQTQHDKTLYLLMTIPLSSVFIMFTFLTIGEKFSFTPPLNFMVITCSIFLLIINFLVFGLNQYNQKKNIEFIEMQLNLQKESYLHRYYEMLLLQTENQNILIHDIKKHLQTINLLNQKKNNKEIAAYIQQLMVSSDLKESCRICDNEMLNAILCRYQQYCNKNNIDFHTDIRSNTILSVSPNDLTSLFCNLLDNALEATTNVPNSFIDVSMQKKKSNSLVVIVVINSCIKKPQTDKEGIPISQKTEQGIHGLGIKSIKKVIHKYNGYLQMYYDNSTNTFHSIITLKQ